MTECGKELMEPFYSMKNLTRLVSLSGVHLDSHFFHS